MDNYFKIENAVSLIFIQVFFGDFISIEYISHSGISGSKFMYIFFLTLLDAARFTFAKLYLWRLPPTVCDCLFLPVLINTWDYQTFSIFQSDREKQ